MEKKTIAILAIAAAGTAALGACIAKCASSDKGEEKKSKGVEPIDFDDDDDIWNDDDWEGEWDDLDASTETKEDRDLIYENAAENVKQILKRYDIAAQDTNAPGIAVDLIDSYCKALNDNSDSLNIDIKFRDADSDDSAE